MRGALPWPLRMRTILAHMTFAGLVGHFGHSSVKQLARAANDGVPLERRPRIVLVGLNVEMPKNALISFQFVIGQLLRNELPVGIMRIIAFDPGKHFAKRRSQFCQRGILLGCEIVLNQFLALNRSPNQFGSRWTTDEA